VVAAVVVSGLDPETLLPLAGETLLPSDGAPGAPATPRLRVNIAGETMQIEEDGSATDPDAMCAAMRRDKQMLTKMRKNKPEWASIVTGRADGSYDVNAFQKMMRDNCSLLAWPPTCHLVPTHTPPRRPPTYASSPPPTCHLSRPSTRIPPRSPAHPPTATCRWSSRAHLMLGSVCDSHDGRLGTEGLRGHEAQRRRQRARPGDLPPGRQAQGPTQQAVAQGGA
jgi:hypothetical protein